MNTKQFNAREALPQRYPFLMIDRIVSLDYYQKIHAYKNISHNEAIFQGHFPDYPIFPGVLQIEAMAQACGCLTYYTFESELDRENDTRDWAERMRDYQFFLVKTDKTKFKHQVTPGDRLDIFASIAREPKKNIWTFNVHCKVEDRLVSEAIISCFIAKAS